MKRYLLSLIGALAASCAAWAQSPLPAEAYRPIPIGTNAAPTAIVQTPTVAPAATAPAVMVTVPATAVPATTTVAVTATESTAAHGGACDAGCVKTKTVCIAVPDKVTKTKVLFSSECDTICLKSLFHKQGGDCNECPLGGCGHAKNVKSLYKRVETTTCDSYKCVPTQVPVCGTNCANGHCVGTSAAAAGQADQVIPTSVRPKLSLLSLGR